MDHVGDRGLDERFFTGMDLDGNGMRGIWLGLYATEYEQLVGCCQKRNEFVSSIKCRA